MKKPPLSGRYLSGNVYTIVERLKAGGVESPERHKRRAGSRNGDNIQGEGWCPSTI